MVVGYDVFISYSHGGDDLLSERVQDALGKFAKPWYRRRALKVFRDRTALAANPGLWTSISEAIDDSRYFLFLASPESAESVWCGREVSQWRAKHGSEGLLVLQTDGEIKWDESANDFDWGATTALGAAFAGAFAEEPFHVDMRWARSEVQLDVTDGRFRDQIADIASPVHGVPKDELTGEDVRQHRRAIRLAIGAAIALAFLTVAAVAMSVFAVNSAAAARRNAAQARAAEKATKTALDQVLQEKKKTELQRALAISNEKDAKANAKTARENERLANENADRARKARRLAENRAVSLARANNNLTRRGLALRQSTLLAQARLAARRSEQLMGSGDQTYQLGVLLASEALRHACASAAIDPNVLVKAGPDYYPNDGCAQSVDIDGSVAGSAVSALANAGGGFVTGKLAGTGSYTTADGTTLPYRVAWSADGQRLATFSTVPSNPAQAVQVWNADGSLTATATSAAGMTSETALSADGTTLALTSNTPSGGASVSAQPLQGGPDPLGGAGHRPALSANGSVMAWLAPNRAKAVAIKVGQASPRAVALPRTPVEVAVSADGSAVAALVATAPDTYSLVPIDVASGRAGRAVAVGRFAAGVSLWSNPPRITPHATADPPAMWFDASRPRVWVYTNERHVGVSVRATTATVVDRWSVPPALSSGDPLSFQTSTPSGRVAVIVNFNAAIPNYEVWTNVGSGWTTTGTAPLQLCISQGSCSLSISPNGTQLAVSSLSALQIIHLTSPAGSASGIIANAGSTPAGATVVSGPSGRTALGWSAQTVALVDSATRSVRRLPIPLATGERFDAVGFSPRGAYYVAVIGHGTACPCRAVILDATSGSVVGGAQLGSTALTANAARKPVGVSLDDNASTIAVTFDDRPGSSTGAHHAALVTYSAQGVPLQVRPNESLGIDNTIVSAPMFEPGSSNVALVATVRGSRVGGLIIDARSGVIAHTLGMQAGVVTLPSNSYGNDGSALRFSPDARKLAWNAGGSVVIWDVGDAGAGAGVSSNVVLTSSSSFDPTGLAITNTGQVATVGYSYYNELRNIGTNVVLTGDELGRFLQPVGVARLASPTLASAPGQMSVAMPSNGQIASVTLDFNGSRFFTDTYGATPATLLAQLCASSSRAITPEEWQTYFPGEPYTPACASPASTPQALDATPPALIPRVTVPTAARAASASLGVPAQAYRKRYIGIVSNSLAVVTRPTYSQAKSPSHSSVHTAAKASVT